MSDEFIMEHAGSEGEIFEDLKGYENLYVISSKGYVISIKTDHILEAHPHKDGYFYVTLDDNNTRNSQAVHRLVARTFLGERPAGKNIEIDHIDGDVDDNREENLRYVTHSDNMLNAYRTGNHPGPAKKIVCRLNKDGNVVERYESLKLAATDVGLKSSSPITICCQNPDKKFTAGGYMWRYSKINKEYKPILHADEIFKKLFSEEHNLLFSEYEISQYGNVRRIGTEKYMKPHLVAGYHRVNLVDDNCESSNPKVHRLVAYMYLDKPDDIKANVVNHMDEDRINNYFKNLEWTTSRKNTIHSLGKPVAQIDMKTGKTIKEFDCISSAAESVKKPNPVPNISACCHGRLPSAYGYRWKFI